MSTTPLLQAILHTMHPNSFASLLFFSITFIFLAYKLSRKLRFNKLPPGPRKRWWSRSVIGNLDNGSEPRCRWFAEWAKIYGPIYSVYLDSKLNIIVNNSELAKEVLKDNDQYVADRSRSKALDRMTRNGTDLIWADYGPHYVRVRKLCNLELFSPKKIEDLRPIREDEVSAMVESIYKDCSSPDSSGKGLLIRDYLMSATTNNVTRLIFGKRFADLDSETDELAQKFRSIIPKGSNIGHNSLMIKLKQWIFRMLKAQNLAIVEHFERMDRVVRLIMEEHALASKKNSSTKHHFLDTLLTLREEYELSDDTIIGLPRDMIAGGTDTIAAAVEWAITELVKNPRVQTKAQEELDRQIGPDRTVTESDIPNLPYLQCIAKEAIRLHPPVPLLLPHKATANIKIGGYDIPKNSVVYVNAWAIGRDPGVWKDPLEFRPERFLEEDVNVKGQDFRLLPFGSGRRVCPGALLGINLVTSILGHFLHQFSWMPPEGVRPADIDMSEKYGVVGFIRTPLQVVAMPRLAQNLYKRMPMNV